jgi:asparagine synthetase B (glutamine-hydrolysing)
MLARMADAIAHRGPDDVGEWYSGDLSVGLTPVVFPSSTCHATGISPWSDPSAVVAMAREMSPDIECFTIDTGAVRDAGVTDDLPYARRVAKHLGVKLRILAAPSSAPARRRSTRTAGPCRTAPG